MSDTPQRYYATHGPVTDPGIYAPLLHALPTDIPALCRVVQGLVLHYRLGNAYGWSIPHDRVPSSDLRGVAAILAQMQHLDARPLDQPRPVEHRFIGHCRVSAVLLCAMLRTHGVPACTRAGFEAYHGRGYEAGTFDHWVCEYWHADEQRWVLVDPEIDEVQHALFKITVDPYDIPRDRFITAGQAWHDCRAGVVAPTQFGLDPTDTGLDYVRSQVVRDLAALNKWEPSVSDRWGLSGRAATSLVDRDMALLDQVATLTQRGPRDLVPLRTLYDADPRLRPTLD